MRMNRRARPEVPKYSDSPLLTGPFVRPWKPEEELLPARSLHALARSRCPIRASPESSLRFSAPFSHLLSTSFSPVAKLLNLPLRASAPAGSKGLLTPSHHSSRSLP